MVTKGERRGKGFWETGIDIYTLLYIKQINKKNYCITQGTLFSTV